MTIEAPSRAEPASRHAETTLVVRDQEMSLFPGAVTSLEEAKAGYEQLRQFTRSLLVEGKDGYGDYGIIPYSGAKKPSLFKSGAEKLAQIYGFAADFDLVDEQAVFDDAHYEKAPGRAYFGFRYKCSLRHKRTGQLVASCIGECNTNEARFQKRDGSWKDSFSERNGAAKIAQKRAFVGATLIACAASSLFTQDLEDQAEPAPREPRRQSQQSTASPASRGTARAGNGADTLFPQERIAGLQAQVVRLARGQGVDEPTARAWMDAELAAAGGTWHQLTVSAANALLSAARNSDFSGQVPPDPGEGRDEPGEPEPGSWEAIAEEA